MRKNIMYLLLLVVIISLGFVYLNKMTDEVDTTASSYFHDELVRAGIERIGQPIEGFTAFMYLDAFPGFVDSDFDGVVSLEGVYELQDGELVYRRTAGNPVTSAEDVLSSEGYSTLLSNFSERVGVEVSDEADIATILEKLREGDVEQNSYIHEDFSITLPEGWYPYENGPGVFFVHDANLEVPQNTDGFALGPYVQVSLHEVTAEELFAQNQWDEQSEFLVSREDVRFGNEEAIKVITNAAGAGGEVLHYVFESNDGRVFVLSHYPYERGSSDTDDFERAAVSFMINYVYDGGGAGGILPFKSGVRGKVLLGPTCPVMQDPPDPNCADKPYITTVQVIQKNSPKSSLFSSVETDKEGNFRVMLPPGEYRLQALGDNPFPQCEWSEITIGPDEMVEENLSCDTGIR